MNKDTGNKKDTSKAGFSLKELSKEKVMDDRVNGYVKNRVFKEFEVDITGGSFKFTRVEDDQFTILVLSPQEKHLFHVTVKYPVENWNGDNKVAILGSPRILHLHEVKLKQGQTNRQYFDEWRDVYQD